MKHYQGERDSIFDWEADLRKMAVPTLLAVGDEDAPCVATNVWLKGVLPNAGLWLCPRTGHAINLEEPAAFNREVAAFLSTVERGRLDAGVIPASRGEKPCRSASVLTGMGNYRRAAK